MEYNIVDTGYLNADKTGTQLDEEDRAGYDGTSSVNVIPLPEVISCTFGGQANINDSPQIGTNTITSIGKNSVENELVSVTFAYKRDSVPSGTWSKSYAWQLNRLKYTEGVKLIYPSGAGSMNTSLMQLGAYYTNGSMSTDFIPVDIPYVPVEVVLVKFTDMPKSKYVKVTLTLRRTE